MTSDVIALDAERMSRESRLSSLSGARVLVTGASGLIGTYFLAYLAALKARGCTIDVWGQTMSPPPDHVSEIVRRGGFHLLQADLSDMRTLSQLPEADLVVHAAGYAQPTRFMEDPVSTLSINASATLSLLKRLPPDGHFLFMSSAHVYLGLREGVCAENVVGTTTPAHPRAPYVEGKRAGEAACHAYRSRGLHATAIRLGDVYGPGTRRADKRALNSFIERALLTGEVRMLDSGAAVRSFCYVSDAVEVMMRILLGGREVVYNVGGHHATTIATVAAIIGRLTGASFLPGPSGPGVDGAPDSLVLDLTRVDREFGPYETTLIETGLAATVQWQRGLYLAELELDR